MLYVSSLRQPLFRTRVTTCCGSLSQASRAPPAAARTRPPARRSRPPARPVPPRVLPPVPSRPSPCPHPSPARPVPRVLPPVPSLLVSLRDSLVCLSPCLVSLSALAPPLCPSHTTFCCCGNERRRPVHVRLAAHHASGAGPSRIPRVETHAACCSVSHWRAPLRLPLPRSHCSATTADRTVTARACLTRHNPVAEHGAGVHAPCAVSGRSIARAPPPRWTVAVASPRRTGASPRRTGGRGPLRGGRGPLRGGRADGGLSCWPLLPGDDTAAWHLGLVTTRRSARPQAKPVPPHR